MEKKTDAPYILIVEDEPEIRDLIAEILDTTPYRLMLTANGRDALDLVEKGIPFSLILSDINMPVMDGLRLFEEVRAIGSGVPFVFLTAYGDAGHMIRALRLGAFDFIQKPFEADRLKRTVRAAVEAGIAVLHNSRLLESISIEGGALDRISKKIAQNDNTEHAMRLRNKRNADTESVD
jgi:DNA-binding NtrC family response regulator